ncbi:MAG TPA: DUF1028 domain-containing protein [Thermoanaerobaculia bacterium]|nr:DUF1028 domain-containing protein [Thermoanaerobaculia bacterium]
MSKHAIRSISTLILAAALVAPPAASTRDARSADGVTLAPDGTPHYSTFSICAIDPETGEAAVAVTTRVPFVGRAVPWVRAGVGAVATQAWTVVEYGQRGLDLLESGIAPPEALERLLSDDNGRERRQLALIDMSGRTAAFTGKETSAWAGSRQGPNYTVQGNIMVGAEVVDAVADHFESTAGSGMPLAERLILALESGQSRGGDKRWGYFQSAAIRVADPNDPGRGGDHVSLSIDVGEHDDPVAEMKRIYYRTGRRLGWRSFSEVRGSDVIELKRMLHALGYWEKDLPEFPNAPDFDADRSLMRSDPEKFQAQLDTYRTKARDYEERFAPYDAAVIDAVDRFREDHGLDYEGNPAGLVDERLVAALRKAYYSKPRDGAP